MKENKYDDPRFFSQYKQMARSVGGLQASGEWHEFRKMMPDFRDRRVLDLGCGFCWHCLYAAEQGARRVMGIDLSEKMLQEARLKTTATSIEYIHMPVEDIDFPENSFDTVISSLVFHYIKSFDDICKGVSRCLALHPVAILSFLSNIPFLPHRGSSDGIAMQMANHCTGR